MEPNAAIFCRRATTQEKYVKDLNRQVQELTPSNIKSTLLEPCQTQAIAASAVFHRAGILSRVYNGDYHTDTFSFDRLSEKVRAGDELIWFWGSAEEISKVRSGDRSLEPLAGTVTMLQAPDFGPGHAELCRFGSLSPIKASPYSILRVLAFFRGEIALSGEKPQTLVITPRNRPSGAGLVGGEAVNKLHRERISSRFFGFAPWYVMQGGFLEILELREIHKTIEAVSDGIAGERLFVRSDSDAQFLRALYRLNYGREPEITITNHRGAQRTLFAAITDSPPELLKYNHQTFSPSAHGTFALEDLLAINEPAVTVVRLCLNDMGSGELQHELNRYGFILTGFSPRKVGPGGRPETFGFWARGGCWPVAAPYYIASDAFDWEQSIVIERLRKINSTLVGRHG